MDSRKPNKIREIVKLQQILKKWRNLATSSKTNSNNSGIKFLRRTLSGSENSSSVPKGYLAVSVGKEQKRYIIPTDYLSHQAFHMLLQEAEEEFGFQQAGVLRIPCEVPVFENVLKTMEDKKKDAYFTMYECSRYISDDALSYCSSDCQRTPPHHPQSPLCR